jgi:hypothetical protein
MHPNASLPLSNVVPAIVAYPGVLVTFNDPVQRRAGNSEQPGQFHFGFSEPFHKRIRGFSKTKCMRCNAKFSSCSQRKGATHSDPARRDPEKEIPLNDHSANSETWAEHSDWVSGAIGVIHFFAENAGIYQTQS